MSFSLTTMCISNSEPQSLQCTHVIIRTIQALQSRELAAKVADNVGTLSSRLDTEERLAERKTSALRKAIQDMTQQQVVGQLAHSMHTSTSFEHISFVIPTLLTNR